MRKFSFLFLIVATSILLSCSKDEKNTLSVNQSEVSLHYDEEFQFNINIDGATVAWSDITTRVEDENVGEVNNSGMFTASTVGTTIVRFQYGNLSVESEVTVVPYYNLFAEPFTEWGSDVGSVKAAETRSIDAEIATAIMYKGENSDIRNVMYMFEDGKLNGAIVLLANRSDLVEKAAKFYDERYRLIGTDDGVIYFQSGDVVVGLGVNDSMGFSAIYIDGSSVQARSAVAKAKSNGFSSDIKVLKLK